MACNYKCGLRFWKIPANSPPIYEKKKEKKMQRKQQQETCDSGTFQSK